MTDVGESARVGLRDLERRARTASGDESSLSSSSSSEAEPESESSSPVTNEHISQERWSPHLQPVRQIGTRLRHQHRVDEASRCNGANQSESAFADRPRL